MSKEKYIFTYENRTDANKKRFTTLKTEEVNVYRGEYNEILERTNIEIIENLKAVYNVVKRVFGNVVELQNGDRVSWQAF